MPTLNKFNDLSEQIIKGVHHFGADTFKLFLASASPAAANTVLTDITQVAYTNISGAAAPTVTVAESESAGTTTVTAVSLTITATGAVPTFQYYGLYNDSATSPLDALVCWFDHGSAITLASGETFSVKFNSANVGSPGTLFTLA